MSSLKKLALSSLSFIFIALSFSFAQAHGFEHPRYDITASVDVSQKEISAKQIVTFTNNSSRDIRELYFHIYPNRYYTPKEKQFMLFYAGYFKVDLFPEGFQRGRLHIQSVVNKGRPLKFEVTGKDQTLLKVPLNTPLKPGGSITVSMDFTVDLPHAFGRLGWHENIIMSSHWYPILSVHNEEGWNKNPFYPFHRPFFSEAAEYSVALTVPRDQVVIHSGFLRRETSQAPDTKILHIQSSSPIREFTFSMSPDYKLVEDQYDGIKVKSFYLKGDHARAQKALEHAKDLMQFYTQRFGAYPYKQFSIAPVYLGYGGEQMSNMVFIDTRVYKLPNLLSRHFDFLIAHETGHQWFYNTVGIDEYSEMWLEEGIHSYFIMEYLEDKYGENASIAEFPYWFEDMKWLLPDVTFRRARDFRYKAITRIGFDHAVVDKLSSFREPSSIFSLTYGKGSRIVEMLEAVIGPDAFNRVFERVFKEFRFRNLLIKDFIRMCEKESGKDLSEFFRQWLYTAEHLNYAVTGVRGNTIMLQNRGGIIMPAEVEVHFSDGRQKSFIWEGARNRDVVILDETTPVTRVQIDPKGTLLDIDRVDNHWPRRLHIKPVPFYFGLYDIPLFLPEDSYNLVVGPEMAHSGFGLKASLQKPYAYNFYAATDYEFGEDLHHSRTGYQLNNFLHSQTTLGFELANTNDMDGGVDDLVSGKVYLRRELWPAQYGMADINDHVTFYLIRNQRPNDSAQFLSGKEDDRNLEYSRREESIAGLALHLNQSGPYPDPRQGYTLDVFTENAGHFWGSGQYFQRTAVDVSHYHAMTPKTTLAVRMKYGWGSPDEKDLFQLGGSDGLRGYGRKTIRGSNTLLGSMEYRFPLKERIGLYALDNILGLESISGVAFFDAGQSWFSKFEDARLKKNAGVGLRFKVSIGSFLEKVIVRADVAKAVNDSAEDTQFWFGINHAF